MTDGERRPYSPRGKMTKQALLAFAATPLIAALLYVTISSFDGAFTLGTGEILIAAVLMYCGALFLEVLLALPSYLLLRHFDCIRWWSASGVGFVVGYVGALVIRTPVAPVLRGNIPIALIGVISGLGFWLLARKSSPETS
jgi:riboflavin transporter FmnP